MLFRVLGPLAVESVGGTVRLGPRQRLLLAVLLVEIGQVMPATRLVELLWGSQASEAASVTLRSHIHHLRRTLESVGATCTRSPTTTGTSGTSGTRHTTGDAGSEILVTVEGGYRLCVSPEQIDAVRFRQMVREGRDAFAAGDPTTAAKSLRTALALWRGPAALQDMADLSFTVQYAKELAAVRRAAVDVRIEADLALGHHAELVGELRGLADRSFDEITWTRLALALYRSHMLDAAAQVCREGLERLCTRSLDAPSLRELQCAILRRDPSLDWIPPRACVPLTAQRSGEPRAEPTPETPQPATSPIPELTAELTREATRGLPAELTPQVAAELTPELTPRQLPPPPPHFVGRQRELGLLHQLLPPETGGIVVVAGVAGVGKTVLALRWLHDRSADPGVGCLYVDLRGHGADGLLTPTEALGQFLRTLGVAPERVPASLDERAGLYRSLTARRPVLVLLDDAASAAQVRPLVPGSAESLLIVTSRRRLGGLLVDGARLLPLGPMSEGESAELLARVVGDERLRGEPAAAAALVGYCGGLPLAVCAAGARVAARPEAPIASVVEELCGRPPRDLEGEPGAEPGADLGRGEYLGLDALSVEDVSVRAALDRSYDALPAESAELYRQASQLPGADFGRPVVAAAAGISVGAASRLLGGLLDASLLNDTGTDRYGFHNLVRMHAQLQADSTDTPAEREKVARRAVDCYLACANLADHVVMPGRYREPRTYVFPLPAGPQLSFAGPTDALTWLETERFNLLAVVRLAVRRRWYSAAWQLVDSMWSLFLYRKHYQDWIESHRLGIGAARACSDVGGETMLLNHLGLAFHGLGQFSEALDCFDQAFTCHRAADDSRGVATALNSSGLALRGLGRGWDAARCFAQAATLQQNLGDRRGEALTRANLGRSYAEAGRADEACRQLSYARSAFAALADPYNEARTLRSLGNLYTWAGRADLAVRRLEPALEVVRGLGSPFEEAQLLEAFGDAVRLVGDHGAARRRYEQALGLYQKLEGPHADRLRRRLDID